MLNSIHSSARNLPNSSLAASSLSDFSVRNSLVRSRSK